MLFVVPAGPAKQLPHDSRLQLHAQLKYLYMARKAVGRYTRYTLITIFRISVLAVAPSSSTNHRILLIPIILHSGLISYLLYSVLCAVLIIMLCPTHHYFQFRIRKVVVRIFAIQAMTEFFLHYIILDPGFRLYTAL